MEERDFETISFVPVPDIARPADGDMPAAIGEPGEFPYTRSIHPLGYRTRLWTMRQFAGFGSALDTNRRFRDLLAKGQTGLSVAFDMPTLMGLDSDHVLAEGEVGHCGAAIDDVADMETIFDGIDIGGVSTSMTINGPAQVLFAFYLVSAERQGVPWAQLRGTLQTDIFKEYIAQKEWCFPPRPHLRLIGDLMTFCAAEVPKFSTISVSGYHIREAGSTAAQELAFTLADGFAYVEQGVRAGLTVDVAAQQLSFFFDAHIDFFEEIAKFRAARRIWARWLRDRYGAEEERSWKLRFHTQTAGVSLTAQQPVLNVARTAVEALAAVLGGTQSLHTNSLDETYALPTEETARIALRTQQVIAYETGVPSTVDPLGGSWFVEAMTDRIEAEAEAYFARIDQMGNGSILEGVLMGIENGFLVGEIADAAYEFEKRVVNGRRVVVGVNRFVDDDDEHIDILRIPPSMEAEQIAALGERKAGRDSPAVEAALDTLRDAARGSANTMPPMIDAARKGATEGEIIGALKDVFGGYRETAVL